MHTTEHLPPPKSNLAAVLYEDGYETWKDIAILKGLYQVSSTGRARSLSRFVNHPKGGKKLVTGRILKLYNSKGYSYLSLGDHGTYTMHRLIAKTFIPNPFNKPCDNHIDGDKWNNHVKNLEWVTYSENEKHSYNKLGKIGKGPDWSNHGPMDFTWSKPLAKVVNGQTVQVFANAVVAAPFLDMGKQAINRACRERRNLRKKSFVLRYITREEFAVYEKINAHG